MKISEIFELGVGQAQLDFVDVDLDKDIPLFIDPYFLSIRNDRWSLECSHIIKAFFQHILELISSNHIDEARGKFDFLHEPSETCLGLSKTSSLRGRGVGSIDTGNIFNNILRSRAVQTGLVRDLEDSIIFVDNIGKDKVSDMATNIIRKHLITYTQAQCKYWDIEMTSNFPSGYYWDETTRGWVMESTDMLVVQNRAVLLIPKGIVSYSKSYVPDKYFKRFVAEFHRNEHLRLGTSLVRFKKTKTGAEIAYVNKQDVYDDIKAKIAAGEYSGYNEIITDYALDNPDTLNAFKSIMASKTTSLTNEELYEFIGEYNFDELIDSLISSLVAISAGGEEATDYHKYCKGLLEFLFYPHLINPIIEQEIHEGRKRIDIVLDNAARNGVFYLLHETHHIPCQYIFVECKNYSRDISNPEIDQLSGRFSINRGKVGLLMCRSIDDFKRFLDRCTDTYRDDRGLVIPIVDDDLITCLNYLKEGNDEKIDRLLNERIRSIILR